MNTELLNKIKETSSTNEKIYLAVNGFTEKEHEFMTECFNNVIYGISETNISKAIGYNPSINGKFEDLGEFLEKKPKELIGYEGAYIQTETELTIKEFLFIILSFSGNEQIEVLRKTLNNKISYEDRPWYIRVLLKNPRIGISKVNYNKIRIKQGLKPLESFYVKLCTLLEPEEFTSLNYPCLAEIKYDGERAVITCDKGNISITSRNGNDISKQYPEVINKLKEIMKVDNYILDGEIISSSFNALQKRMNRLESNINTDYDIEFVCFDVLAYDNDIIKEKHQIVRRAIVENLKEDFNLNISNCKVCHNIEELNEFYKKAVENKEEGIIIKDLNAKWALKEEDRELWYKVKPTYTSDLEIYKVDYGSGKNKDYINILHVKDKTGAFKTNVSSGITDDQRKFLTHMNNKGELIGKIVEVKYNQLTETNSLRHPRVIRLRFDKDIADELHFT